MADIAAILVESLQRSPWGWALLATVLVALIRAWPVLSRQAMEERAKIRGEKRDDLDSCVKRLRDMRLEIDAVKEAVSSYQIKLNGVLIAYRIVEAAYEIEHPDSGAVSQARAVLRTAFSIGELPVDFNDLLRKAG